MAFMSKVQRKEARDSAILEAEEQTSPLESQTDEYVMENGAGPIVDVDLETLSTEDESPFISSDAFLPGETANVRRRLIYSLLDLDYNERTLLKYIQETEEHINKSRPQEEHIGVYYTGGFVRDKLLGLQPSNLDIVLMNINAAEFVQALIDHHGWDDHSPQRIWPESYFDLLSRKRGVNKRGACRTHQFEYTAPSGKNIQVVGIAQYFLGLTCEFVSIPGNMQSEDEQKAVLFQDAMQRELTVNALYIRSRDLAILDPSGMGLKDLHEKVLRTPKAPRETLLADPIRVLRVMKFVGRLQDDGFALEPTLTGALKDPYVKEALLTSYDPERIQREIAITLAPKNNPYRILQVIRGIGYYNDLISPPSPTEQSPLRARDILHPTTKHRDFFAAAYFVQRISSKWECWAPFEEALYNLPSKGYVQSDSEKIKVMMIARENVLSFAYAIAIALPYQHIPPTRDLLATFPENEPKTVPGQIIQQLSNRLIRPWHLVDQMFLHPKKTADSIQKVLHLETVELWEQFLEEYGPYWAGHVLCGAILRWTDLAREAKWAAEYDVLWRRSEKSWTELCRAVDRVRWNRWIREPAK